MQGVSEALSDVDELPDAVEEGPALTPEQEEDITYVLNEQDWTVNDAGELSSVLSRELEALDQANIVAILNSEQQVNAVMEQLDLAFQALEQVNERVSRYKAEIEPIKKRVDMVGALEGNVDLRYENEKMLMEETKKLVHELEFPDDLMEALIGGDLRDAESARKCTKAVELLRQKDLNNFHPGLVELSVVQQRTTKFASLKESFAERFVNFFTQLCGEMSTNFDDHNRQRSLERYATMSRWLRDVEPESKDFSLYSSACEAYGKAINCVTRIRTTKACESCKVDLGGSSKKQNTAANDLRSRLAFDSAFEKMLADLIPFYLSEYIFAESLFARAKGAVENDAEAESLASTNSPAMHSMLQQLFKGISVALTQLVEDVAKVDRFYSLSMLVRLEKHTRTVPAEFGILHTLLQGIIRTVNGMFHDFMADRLQQFAQAKLPKQKKIGILPMIDDFVVLVKHIQQHLDAAHCSESAVRSSIDRKLIELSHALDTAINNTAEECKREVQLVVLFENFHYLNDHLRQLKVGRVVSCVAHFVAV